MMSQNAVKKVFCVPLQQGIQWKRCMGVLDVMQKTKAGLSIVQAKLSYLAEQSQLEVTADYFSLSLLKQCYTMNNLRPQFV